MVTPPLRDHHDTTANDDVTRRRLAHFLRVEAAIDRLRAIVTALLRPIGLHIQQSSERSRIDVMAELNDRERQRARVQSIDSVCARDAAPLRHGNALARKSTWCGFRKLLSQSRWIDEQKRSVCLREALYRKLSTRPHRNLRRRRRRRDSDNRTGERFATGMDERPNKGRGKRKQRGCNRRERHRKARHIILRLAERHQRLHAEREQHQRIDNASRHNTAGDRWRDRRACRHQNWRCRISC